MVDLLVFSLSVIKLTLQIDSTSSKGTLLPQDNGSIAVRRRNSLKLWWILLEKRPAQSTRMYLVINIAVALVTTTVVMLLAAEVEKNGFVSFLIIHVERTKACFPMEAHIC